MHHILAIDDDDVFLKSIRNLLEYQNYKVTTCNNPAKVTALQQENHFDCVLLDVKMPGIDGLELLAGLLNRDRNLPVIMISGHSTIKIAVEALKLGAFDFIEKPVDADRLLITLKNALKTQDLFKEKTALIAELEQKYHIVAVSEAMKKVLAKIETVAPTGAKVLITGETGTGKELVARALHLKSDRSSGPFVKVNCAAIPKELMESELFGHKKGAFTGAFKETAGKFQMADHGTLFLDEIGDMDLMLQAKLLHVLQDNEFMMLGATDSVRVDVRIVAATNQNIEQLTTSGKFREDLLHRINVVNIHVPSLRERPNDIPVLANHFLEIYRDHYNKRLDGFAPEATSILMQYEWPGNVRELRNLVEKSVIFAQNTTIRANDVLNILGGSSEKEKPPLRPLPLKEELARYEREYILRVLNANGWRMIESAKQLGFDRSTLYKKMQKLNIKKN